MAESMRDIKRRIRSIENTKKITKAMKMVAAANLRRAQDRVEAARPYSEQLRDVIVNLAAGTQGVDHPMLVSREVKKTGYLVITSDRGLAGGYNSNLLRHLMQTLKKRHKSTDEYVIFVIGRKGVDFLKRRNQPIIGQVTGLPEAPAFADVKAVASQAVNDYADEKFDELYLLYNEFVNPVTQRPTEKRLLPLASTELEETQKSNTIYEYEPSVEEVLEEILPRYAETLIFAALLEGKASEFAAKMMAMSNATDNATELIANNRLLYNRARQAAITQEIAEIVGGAAAL
ncbi:F0F1 ATP synthase subunit gamma [Hazenella sp. IB182357]|uniref:ATP synthase gamma chain n=1 Tax=Polycladospora coralii TaxID=2771432 RepID=A0A926RTU7_9BACL|nr:ATP synthase F1 subunit gamma [Polycladospora coralii]MBD1372133.1 F0F1 ATP synthase subunit gamma [Polycladospora coralii]MBS7530639.1 F0F1 ATP synthase subunit gamma [Polycladospora coralii]